MRSEVVGAWDLAPSGKGGEVNLEEPDCWVVGRRWQGLIAMLPSLLSV